MAARRSGRTLPRLRRSVATAASPNTNNPSRANFSLTPIHTIFSGAQAIALQQAYAAYGSNRVHVESYRDRVSTVLVNGTPVLPPGGYPTNEGAGWHMIVLDSRNNSVVFNKYYDIEFGMANWPDGTYGTMANDISPYLGSLNYILVLAGCKMNEGANPNNTFYGILKSFGAGTGLDAWMQREHGCAGGNAVAYALVGAGTSVNGCEAFIDIYIAPYAQTEGVTVDAFLQPGAGHFTPVPFQPS